MLKNFLGNVLICLVCFSAIIPIAVVVVIPVIAGHFFGEIGVLIAFFTECILASATIMTFTDWLHKET